MKRKTAHKRKTAPPSAFWTGVFVRRSAIPSNETEISCGGREWSELGSRDMDGRAERPSERERKSQSASPAEKVL